MISKKAPPPSPRPCVKRVRVCLSWKSCKATLSLTAWSWKWAEMFFLLCCRNSAWKENRGNLILLAVLRMNKAVNRTALSLYCNSRLIQLFSDFLGTLQGTTVFRGPCNDPNSYLTGSGFEWVLASWLIRRAARQTCLLHSERSQLFHDRWMRWVTVM